MDFKDDFYEILFEAIREGLILVDANGVIADINKSANKMFGYKDKELIGQNIEVLVPLKSRNVHAKHREKYSEKPTIRLMGATVKLDGVRKDNTEFSVQVSLNPFKNKNNENFVVALVSDITERRENEIKLQKLRESLEQKVKERTQELRESEQLYKSIAKNFPGGIISIFDRSYRYIFAEGQELHKLNVKSADLIGVDYLEKFDKSMKSRIKSELDKVFKGYAKNFEVIVGNNTFLINAVPLIIDEKKKTEKILVVEQNITQQKEVSKKLESALNQELELTEMKSRFVSMASHEFRTPLTTINSSAILIKKHYERGNFTQLPKHVERIKNSVHNLTSILNDFLSFEKLEAGKINVNFNKCNIPALLKETFEEMIGVTKEKQTIKYEGPHELFIKTDELLLKNTILNLLSNAVKYSRVNDEIIVGLKVDGNKVVISIQDFGVGIPEKDKKNLFTRFFRAGNVTNIQGTGLGLNIVLRYLDLLKGDIYFTSTEGQGTIFYINLPLNLK